MRQARARRKGAIMVMVLITMSTACLIALSTTHYLMIQRKATKQNEVKIQAEGLVLSGHQLALAKLQADTTYQGEVWKLEEKDLSAFKSAEIKIEVLKKPESTSQKNIKVQVTLNQGLPNQTALTRQFNIQLPESGETL